jgi:hypothetical protein
MPWGDYGDALAHGIAWRLRKDDPLQLDRCGPFVPPISFPSGFLDVVVTQQMRDCLEAAGFRGLRFILVIKHKIVRIDWQSWDPSAPTPKHLPAGTEPENYILRRKHHPATDEQIGNVWELQAEVAVPTDQRDRLRLLARDHDEDIFRANEENVFGLFVSQRLADWLRQNVSEWVYLERVDVG